MSNKKHNLFLNNNPKQNQNDYIKQPEVISGYVTTDYEKIYVRSEPYKTATPVGTVDKESEVQITDLNASDDFYKIVTGSGLEGYCMKAYIMIPKTSSNS